MKKKSAYIIFTILGVLVIIISFLVKPDQVSNDEFLYVVLLNVGFVILTIVIVNFLWSLFGGDPIETMIHKSADTLKLVSDGFHGGLYRAFLSSSDFATAGEWASLLKKAKKQVDMMGYSLQVWTRTAEFQNILTQLANKNVKVRIMIMDEQNANFSAGLNFDHLDSLSLESMKDEVRACTQCMGSILSHVNKNKKNNVKFVKIKRGLTECQIIRIDGQLYVTPYLYSKHTADSPLFVFREQKGGHFEKYMEEFDMLWNHNL